jgi:hypothetical protein
MEDWAVRKPRASDKFPNPGDWSDSIRFSDWAKPPNKPELEGRHVRPIGFKPSGPKMVELVPGHEARKA